MNKNLQLLQDLLVSLVTCALKDFEANLEIDTSLHVSSSEVPLNNVGQKESPMFFLTLSDKKELVVFKDDQLPDFINISGDNDGLGNIFSGNSITIEQEFEGEIKVFFNSNNCSEEIATKQHFADVGLDLDQLFETIESLIRSEDPDFHFHSHPDINADL